LNYQLCSLFSLSSGQSFKHPPQWYLTRGWSPVLFSLNHCSRHLLGSFASRGLSRQVTYREFLYRLGSIISVNGPLSAGSPVLKRSSLLWADPPTFSPFPKTTAWQQSRFLSLSAAMGPNHFYILLSATLVSLMTFFQGSNPGLIPWYNPISHLQFEGGFRFFPLVSFAPSLSIPLIPYGPICLTTEYRPLLERTPPPPPALCFPSLHDLPSRIASLTLQGLLRRFENYKVWSASPFDRGVAALREALTIASDVQATDPAELDLGVSMFWVIAVKIIMRRGSKTKDTLRESPEVYIRYRDIDRTSATNHPRCRLTRLTWKS